MFPVLVSCLSIPSRPSRSTIRSVRSDDRDPTSDLLFYWHVSYVQSKNPCSVSGLTYKLLPEYNVGMKVNQSLFSCLSISWSQILFSIRCVCVMDSLSLAINNSITCQPANVTLTTFHRFCRIENWEKSRTEILQQLHGNLFRIERTTCRWAAAWPKTAQ